MLYNFMYAFFLLLSFSICATDGVGYQLKLIDGHLFRVPGMMHDHACYCRYEPQSKG